MAMKDAMRRTSSMWLDDQHPEVMRLLDDHAFLKTWKDPAAEEDDDAGADQSKGGAF